MLGRKLPPIKSAKKPRKSLCKSRLKQNSSNDYNRKNRMTLPTLIRRWQIRRKLTNAKAAKTLGVPLRTFGDWKGGQHKPSRIALRAIRERLGR